LTIRTNGTRNQERNLPNVNDLALCIFIPPSLSDGWVIAFGYNDEDQPPEGDENTYITKFPDGSLIRYQKGVIDVQAKSSVNITAPTINISGKLIINKEPYLEHTHKSGLYKDGDSKPVSGTSGTIS
jgi:phage baseplate assembly protein gpV